MRKRRASTNLTKFEIRSGPPGVYIFIFANAFSMFI